MITIYKIINPKGKIYIGQTTHYKSRMSNYKRMNYKGQKKLYNSFKKYGVNNHIIEIIEEVDNIEGDIKEQYWISHFKSYFKDENKGLNLNKGGYRPKQTEETKKKISKAIFGSKHYRAKKLYQYNINGDLIKEWECMRCIERELGYKTTFLSRSIKNNKTAYGYKWFYNPL